MAGSSNIEWTDSSWNPIVGCSIVSPGCTNCYAMRMAARIDKMAETVEALSDRSPSRHYCGLTKSSKAGPVWTGEVAQAPDHILTAPLRWKKPRRVFVNSMGDVFHEAIPDEWIDRVFAVMALAPQHTFQVLTKRAQRMHGYMTTPERKRTIAVQTMYISESLARQRMAKARIKLDHFSVCFAGSGPLPNVWLGVSAERQQEADERIPLLLDTPAAVRFVSLEPLLGPIDLTTITFERAYGTGLLNALTGEKRGHVPNSPLGDGNRLDWSIVGGESGTGARPMHPDWARSIRDQCAAAGVPFFFKQWGAHRVVTDQFGPLGFDRIGKKAAGRILDGRTHDEFPQCGAQ